MRKSCLLIVGVFFVSVISAAPLFRAVQDATEALQAGPKSRPSVSFYLEENFKGRMNRLKAPADFPGSAELKKVGIPNDSLLSMKVPAGVKVSVFDADDYGGDSMTFTEGEHATLGKLARRISSMKVELIKPE
ncbi:MAG: hypothetical protein V4599_15285 [Verrucomicrobiota bacterium]